jgi:hypothetical protein
MWWLLTQLERQWLQMSLIDHVVAKLNTIAKIRKYKGFHEGHHFIPMAMELHNTHPSMIWIISLGNVPIFSTVDD